MYPFAIINSFGSKIERVYRDFARRVNNEIFPMLRRERSRPFPTSERIINDAANVLELLEEIRLNYGDYVDDALLTKIIAENINLLDGWSTSQLNAMIQQQNSKMVGVVGVETGLRPVSTGTGDTGKPTVPLIPRNNVVSMANIPLANNSQRLLQNDAYSKYFFDVEEIINNGIIDGLSTDDITKQILDKVDMNAKRARFWAEDQASIFQAEQTRLKAQREGHTHYRWKCQGNARPSHAVHKDQIYSWNVGVNNLSRPGARHPGEDYRCHCQPELVTPDQIAAAGVGNPSGRSPTPTKELIANYEGKSIVKSEPRDSRPITAFELLTQEGIRLAVVEQNLSAKKSSVLIAQSPLEIGVVYNSKGELINAINGTRNAVTDLDVFASDLINGTFLHNHPGGTSFSFDDIIFFEKSKAKSIIVATKDYRFTIDRGKKVIKANRIQTEFNNMYQAASDEAERLIAKGLLDKKKIAEEIVSIQWDMTCKKLGINYTREPL